MEYPSVPIAFAAYLLMAPLCLSQPVDSTQVSANAANTYPLEVLANIQSNLERVASGKPQIQSPHQDSLERIVDAYAHYLKNELPEADRIVKDIFLLASPRWNHAVDDNRLDYFQKDIYPDRSRYYAKLVKASENDSALVQLMAGLRMIDSVLFIESDLFMDQASMDDRIVSRFFSLYSDPRNDSWLQLPCNTVIGRAKQFDEHADDLKRLGGPILSCPTDQGLAFSELERLVKTPENLSAKVSNPENNLPSSKKPIIPPAKNWSYEDAINYMGHNPKAAEAILSQAAKKDDRGKLDYALFLHAFKKPSTSRNETINRLIGELRAEFNIDDDELLDADERISKTSVVGNQRAELVYNGSDDYLGKVMRRIAPNLDLRNDAYPVPCDVLLEKPGLLLFALVEYPLVGAIPNCGRIDQFPEADLERFLELSHQADGDFEQRYDGSMHKYWAAGRLNSINSMKIMPGEFLSMPEPAFDHPYQTWGMLSLENFAASQRIKKQYKPLHRRLSGYFRHRRGLSAHESKRAAKTAIFQYVFGANCGGGLPTNRIRERILKGEKSKSLIAAATAKDFTDPPEIEECVRFAEKDPLLLLAAGDPATLRSLLEHGVDVNTTNGFGKTALMTAAQHDSLDSVKTLLKAGGNPHITTNSSFGGKYPNLSHDARTALMYAAANGSFQLIQTLLEAGADPHMADTKGKRAIHYLLGFGPLPANPRLKPEELKDAVRLLY